MVLEIVRIIFGFVFVLLLPGLALTSALWPKTKKMVYREVLEVLGEKNSSDVAIVGKTDEIEEVTEFLTKYPIEIKDDSKVMVLVGNLEDQKEEIDTNGKTVIDLGNNLEDAIKIEDTIDVVERLALSIGLSVAIAPLIGLALNYTPFGIKFGSIFVSLSLVILLFFAIYFKRIESWNASRSLS